MRFVQLGIYHRRNATLWIEHRIEGVGIQYACIVDAAVPEDVEVPLGRRQQWELDAFLAQCKMLCRQRLNSHNS